MKFRDKEKGMVYDSWEDTHCDRNCGTCEIHEQYGHQWLCSDIVSKYPEAAELMGYEVVEDETKKPERPTRKSILEAAERCVCGDRDKQYGSPEDSFRVIAALWEVYLKERCVSPETDVCILPEDVAALMVLFKVARIATGQAHSDNWIDAAGYAACGGEIAGEKHE